MSTPQVVVGDSLATVQFNSFDTAAYELFLRCKRLPESTVDYNYELDSYTLTCPARYASLLGVDVPAQEADDLPLSAFLFEHQRAIVRMALDAKRFAVWSDCGTGKTLIFLEYARHIINRTGGRALIITLNDIIGQTMDEAARFFGEGLPIRRLESRAEMREWCASGTGNLAITNYEKMNPDEQGQIVSELRHLDGLILDESSRLKTGGGKQKWAIIKSARGIPYKLSCTATPAPNDMMEFASQGSFLERMRNEEEIIWTYFTRDPRTQEWTVKRHARSAFFEWMSSWSIYVRHPERYGWHVPGEQPPAPVLFEHRLVMTQAQHDAAMRHNVDKEGQIALCPERNLSLVARGKLSQIAKGFVYGETGTEHVESLKPEFIVDLIKREVESGLQVLVWTVFDEETAILAQLLNKTDVMFDTLSGSTKVADRELILEDFRHGRSSVLISKASLLGYGMNFQNCGSMIFSGWNDSYEQMYQAVRRAYRYGQTRAVRVHIPFIPELEGAVLENVMRKQVAFEESVAEQERAYIAALQSLNGRAA